MASEIPWRFLKNKTGKLTILDPMAGSGTTLVTGRALGHDVIGFDTDPLAILISKVWCNEVSSQQVIKKVEAVLVRARKLFRSLKQSQAYPTGSDEETKKFVRYWFCPLNRKQLTALSKCISRIHDPKIRDVLWVAFSRLIITKTNGASLAMDVSHSRPHRVYDNAPLRPFNAFRKSVLRILRSLPELSNSSKAVIASGDARCLSLKANSVDFVITSPPYLNAIDYMRGHKLSLVWMGYRINYLRAIRSTNVGTESGTKKNGLDDITRVMKKTAQLSGLSIRNQNLLRKYIIDMELVLKEVRRVLKPHGEAIFVVGDSNISGTYVRNSVAIKELARSYGLKLVYSTKRDIPDNKRYLPPPARKKSGAQLRKRMRQEVVIRLVKK